MDSTVRVKCLGGRELRGALRGYDELVNLVLDDCEEFIRGKYTILYAPLYRCRQVSWRTPRPSLLFYIVLSPHTFSNTLYVPFSLVHIEFGGEMVGAAS
jgi:small nuclear ribonucleoprotein (snRNP)-like protein